MGCEDRCSTDAARLTTAVLSAVARRASSTEGGLVRAWADAKVITSTTSGVPRVSVPVLSNATQRTRLVRSRYAPPLISTPLRAAPASAATIDTGVEMTSAHGQETTSSTRARYSHTSQTP